MILVSIAALLTTLAYSGLLSYAVYRSGQDSTTEYRLAACCGGSLLLATAFALDGVDLKIFNIAPGLWVALTSLWGLCLLGTLTCSYLGLKSAWVWLLAIVLITGLVLAACFLDPTSGLTTLTWRKALYSVSLSAVSAAGLWIGLGIVLLGVTFSEISKARLPLYANRGLWWGLILLFILAGEAVAIGGPEIISVVGQGVRVIGFGGLAYGVTTHNLIDVRGLFRGVAGNAVFVAITALITLLGMGVAFFILQQYQGSEQQTQGQLLVVAIAIALALVYQVIRSLLSQLVRETVFKTGYDTAAIAAEYSKRIAQILEVGELAGVLGQTLTQSVEATKSALLLLTPYNDNIRAEILIGSGQMPAVGHRFPASTAFFTYLRQTHRPLLQYNLEVKVQFNTMLPIDRRWLQRLGGDIYVPIMDGETLTGIIVVGPRQSGDPYRARELELLQTLGDQTAVALQNARLVTDLRLSNEEILALNQTLATRNEQLKEMDKVKTDFITIASHELRTPLTQILGFADVLKMLSEVDAIPGAEVAPISDSILRASSRLSEVVTQMLDVSQLDGEMLQLHLAETTVDAALQTALAPFAEALYERRLSLNIENITTLPAIQGDVQRLSQAFGQLLSNAIKFTPDGGRIQIEGKSVRENRQSESIEVIVADTGVGIEAKHHELVFEKFFRVGSPTLHSTGTTKFMGAGPGLGLSIAKGIIEAHGGKIWVESQGGDDLLYPGTELHVRLPVRPPAQPTKNGRGALREPSA